MSDDRISNVEWLQAENQRLTAKVERLKGDCDVIDEHNDLLIERVTRLLRITVEMRVGLMESNADVWRRGVLDEWDRRASEVMP